MGATLRRWAIWLQLLLAVFLVLPAPTAQGQVPLTIGLRDALAFEPGSFSADPGENVTLRLMNDGALRHTFTLFAEANAEVPVRDNAALLDFYARSQTLLDVSLEGGEEATVTFTVPAMEGVYTFVCVVPGHSAGGMFGLMAVGVMTGDGGIFGDIGIVQGLLLITLIGTVVFAFIYHVRSTRP